MDNSSGLLNNVSAWILVACAIIANFLSALVILFGMIQATGKLLRGFYQAHQQNLSRLDKIEQKLELMYQWFRNQIGANGRREE